MANIQQKDVLPVGMLIDEAERGSFIKNLYKAPIGALKVREGFGRLYSHNTAYTNTAGDDKGMYRKLLGSYSFNTNFNHKQIISLFIAFTNDQNRNGQDGNYYDFTDANYLRINPDDSFQYVAVVYDITTNRHYEQILTGKTSEIEDIVPMEQQYGYYDNSNTKLSTAKIYPPDPEMASPAYFAELNDIVYFGTKDLGLWAYRPIVFDENPYMQVETSFGGQSYAGGGGTIGQRGISEYSCFERASAVEGLYYQSFVYLNNAEFPTPSDIVTINNRIAMAYGRSIYFSDEFNGAAIFADNILDIPTDREITAIAEIQGVLVIFTDEETFMYQPSVQTQVATAGRTIKINSSYGTINCQSKIKVENRLYVANSNGIFICDGQQMSDISQPVKLLFRKFIETPMTIYDKSTPDGFYYPSPQQSIIYNWNNLKGLHFAKNALNNLILCVVPEQKFALIIDFNGMFSFWSWDTTAQLPLGKTGKVTGYSKTDLSTDFRLVDNGDDIYMINLEELSDINQVSWATYRYVSYYKWKTAGALDFSKTYHEDKKTYPTNLKSLQNYSNENVAIFGCGVPSVVYDGIRTDTNTILFNNPTGSNNAYAPYYLVPFGIQLNPYTAFLFNAYGGRYGIQQFSGHLTYNSTEWEIANNSSSVDIIMHPNHMLSYEDWDVNLNSGKLNFFYSASAPTTNFINVNDNFQTLFWVPMRLKGGEINSNGPNWAISGTFKLNGAEQKIAVIATEFATARRDTTYVSSSTPIEYNQPIEWILQTEDIQEDDGQNVKARGGFAELLTNGPWSSTSPTGTFGLMNAMISSDYNNYQGQIVDWEFSPPSIKDNMRNIQTISETEVLGNSISGSFNTSKTFGNPAIVYDNQFKSLGDIVDGNYLVDGEDNMETSFSTSIKGTAYSIMLYGFTQSFATKMLIKKLTSAYRAMGDAKRRWKNYRGSI